MKSAIQVISLLGLTFCTAAVKAECDPLTSTTAVVSGEINNNAVSIVSPNDAVISDPTGQTFYTLGVADIKMIKSNSRIKLNCTLLGEPTGIAPGYGNQYDHMLVCDDEQQSEISFETRFIPGELSDDEIDDFCDNEQSVQFVEEAIVNENRRRKGLFANATGAVIVKGCVNFVGADPYPVIEINMGVEGDVCLPN
jgi:hypothetical protein